MIQLAPCYDREQYNLGNCVIRTGSHEIIGTKSSNPEKCITVLLPTDCIPDGDESIEEAMIKYEAAIKFFKWLREETCICYLVLDGETSHLYPAIMAGWKKKDIILRVYSLDINSLQKKSDEVDRYMKDAGIEQLQSFRAVYMDEPQRIDLAIDSLDPFEKLTDPVKFILYHRYINEFLHTRFIITNYKGWLDYRKIYAPYCDEIIDDGYDDDFEVYEYSVNRLGSKTLLFSMSKIYPEPPIPGLHVSPDQVRKYFEWANTLAVTGVWLWFGEYNDCQRFKQDMKIACKEAAKTGWATYNNVFVETGKRYCKYADCSRCLGRSSYEDDYWQDKPMGPPCPPTVYEKEYDRRTQSVADFIYSQYSFR